MVRPRTALEAFEVRKDAQLSREVEFAIPRSGKGGRVKSRKQAIAIGLSKARNKGQKVPKKKSS
ncbi:hypothetical protein NWI01_33750 [Nitrobacter winogradskyi]|uniref:Uncharacterized protein n=1 Tax=Nitrobacter winogradskyi TaxID=913 RepID=A0A4Y3WF12_NITWI|nr:hypothetical protein NWI01_33750 [Nitrobacter winogradskyi]